MAIRTGIASAKYICMLKADVMTAEEAIGKKTDQTKRNLSHLTEKAKERMGPEG